LSTGGVQTFLQFSETPSMIFGMVAHVKITSVFLLDSLLLPVTSIGETKSDTCDGA